MNPTANPYPLPKSAVWSLALDSVRQMFRPFGPLFPRNFFPPRFGPDSVSCNGPLLKSKFLALAAGAGGGQRAGW